MHGSMALDGWLDALTLCMAPAWKSGRLDGKIRENGIEWRDGWIMDWIMDVRECVQVQVQSTAVGCSLAWVLRLVGFG